MVYGRLNTKSKYRSTRSKKIFNGLLVARTIFADRFSDLPVRVMNVTTRPVTLKRGMPTSELRPVQPVQESQQPDSVPHGHDEGVIEDVLSRVHASVSEDSREKLRETLALSHRLLQR